MNKLLIVLLIVSTIVGCKALFGTSYQGEFHTQSGQCKETGKLIIDASDTELDVRFYCFLEVCAEGEGKLSQGGYFNMYMGNNQYIKGRVSPGKSRGEWQLKLNKEVCSGYWVAEELE